MSAWGVLKSAIEKIRAEKAREKGRKWRRKKFIRTNHTRYTNLVENEKRTRKQRTHVDEEVDWPLIWLTVKRMKARK